MAMLAFLPSVPSIRQRLEVVVWVFVLLMVLMYSWKLFANTVVYLRVPKLAWYQKQSGVLLVFLEVGLSAWIATWCRSFFATSVRTVARIVGKSLAKRLFEVSHHLAGSEEKPHKH